MTHIGGTTFSADLSEYYRSKGSIGVIYASQNLEEAVSRQLCARVSSRISSAWILTAHDDVNGVFVDGLFVQDLVGAAAATTFLFATSTRTENSE